MLQPIEPKVVWRPIENSSQELALDARADEILYTGTRGPGKTDVQLMRFKRRVGLGYGPFWRGIIFDREYKHLDDLVAKSKRWFPKFDDGAEWLSSASAYKWVWPTGEELLFRSIKTEEDYENYHGQEYPFIGWNELTKYPNLKLYDMMMSCNRSSFTPEKDAPIVNGKRIIIPNIPLETFSTCNSYGPGHNAVKARFIAVAPYGKVVKRVAKVFNPQTQQEEDITKTQVALFGSYKENIYLDPKYVAGLHSLKDKNRRKSWLDGSWDVVAGGALDDVWNVAVHVLPRFKVPDTWHLDRTFDWGSSHPFSVGWWAEANGEEATIDLCKICGEKEKRHANIETHAYEARKFCPPKGSLIQFDEWYGTVELGSNEGLKFSAKKIGEGIKVLEQDDLANGWIASQPFPGPADNQIRDVRESDVDTIEKKMADVGVRWTESDKSPGSRRNGLDLIRERLENAETGEGPALYFMENCRASITTLPVLPRDDVHRDDVDTDAEDHPYDMVRYRVLKGSNRAARAVEVVYPT
jgi:hypothetical protein